MKYGYISLWKPCVTVQDTIPRTEMYQRITRRHGGKHQAMANGTTVIINQHLHNFTIEWFKTSLGKEPAFPLGMVV
jgi:hypothetical protein